MAFVNSTTNRKSRGSTGVTGFNNQNGDYTQAMALVNGSNELASVSTDSFGRLRVSEMYPLFETNTRYDIDTTLWTTIGDINGGATTVDTAAAAIVLNPGGADTGQAALRSLKNFRYQAGKSQLIMQTVSILNPTALSSQREWGYYDEGDGIFWQINSNGQFGVVLRDRGQDTFVAQTDFNRDKLDGTGSSGFNIDLSKSNIYGISFQYLGVGVAKLFVYGDKGDIITAHVFENANKNENSYMATAVLPLSYRCLNTNPDTEGGGMKVFCATVNSEAGGDPVYSIVKSADTGVFITEAGSAEKSILSIRSTAQVGGVVNKVEVVPKKLFIACDTSAAIIRLRKNSTYAANNFVPPTDLLSSIETDKVSADGTDGELLSTYVVNKDSTLEIDLYPTVFSPNKNSLTLSNNGVADSLSITIQKVSGSPGAQTDILASITWAEIR